MARLYNYIYQESGVDFTIVHSLDGYDEISLTSVFKVISNHEHGLYTPEDIGFSPIAPEELLGGNTPKDAALIFDRVLHNEATAAQSNVVIANAAVAIRTIEPERSLAACIDIARESLQSGRALKALDTFLQINR
jgi:anthranilate phosphoribosyltransferase